MSTLRAVEIRNARQRGSLVDAEAVEREWEGVCRTIRAGIMRIPRRIGDRAGVSAEVVREIDAEIRDVLTELVDKI